MQKYKSIKDHVYEYISLKIQNGDLMPNQRITEVEISKEMGVSRTPAREALIQLASENLLEKIPRKGFIIKQFNKDEKLEIYELISVLDCLAGYKATERLDDKDILYMEELTDKIDIAIKYRNYPEYAKLQNQFHDVYINKCGNSTLINMLNNLRYNFIPQTYMSEDVEKLFSALKHCNDEHKEIIDCLKNRDGKCTEAMLKKHWLTIDFELI
jgi:DNA-binding GntR family transcriptional regulator